MDSLYISKIVNESVSIEPKYMNNKLEHHILKKLKNKYEGKCIKEGYIKTDSIKILKRSAGKIVSSHFNGNVIFHIKMSIELCNPLNNTVIDVQITNNNKMGILAVIPHDSNSPLNILLPRQYHIDNDTFVGLKIGDIISIKILGTRFEFGESEISVIGVLDEPENKSTISKKKETEEKEEN
jgi:DNA-directed RNA polymerase subunit E'/Rpb7